VRTPLFALSMMISVIRWRMGWGFTASVASGPHGGDGEKYAAYG
jgi:hypothetical protein